MPAHKTASLADEANCVSAADVKRHVIQKLAVLALDGGRSLGVLPRAAAAAGDQAAAGRRRRGWAALRGVRRIEAGRPGVLVSDE